MNTASTIRSVAVAGAFSLLMLDASCQNTSSAQGSSETASNAAVDPPDDPPPIVSQLLVPQDRAGLRMEGLLRRVEGRGDRTHALDLRLTNVNDQAKRFVSIETISLGSQFTYLHRPSPVTLSRRGSSESFPDVASWDLRRSPPPAHQMLTILVRYQADRGPVYASFQWDAKLDRVGPPPTSIPTTQPAQQLSARQ